LDIPMSEFRERQRRALEEAVRRGFKGLLVWSRSGTTYDRHMNVMYLTNYYSPLQEAGIIPSFLQYLYVFL